MFRQGLPAEVRQLLADGFEDAATAAQAIGYAEAIDCVRGRCTQVEAVERTIQRTAKLAKRQMTWFRHQLNVEWIEIDPGEKTGHIAQRVRAVWERTGPTPLMPPGANSRST